MHFTSIVNTDIEGKNSLYVYVYRRIFRNKNIQGTARKDKFSIDFSSIVMWSSSLGNVPGIFYAIVEKTLKPKVLAKKELEESSGKRITKTLLKVNCFCIDSKEWLGARCEEKRMAFYSFRRYHELITTIMVFVK